MIYRLIFFLFFIIYTQFGYTILIEDYDNISKYLKEIQNEIKKENKKLNLVIKSKKDLSSKIQILEKHINEQYKILNSINKKIDEINKEKIKIEEKIKENTQLKKVLEEKIKSFNSYLIDNQKFMKIKLLLFTKRYYDVKSTLDLIDIVNSKIFSLIEEYNKINEKLNNLKKDLNQKTNDLQKIRKLKLSIVNKLENESIQKKQYLALLKEDEQNLKQYLNALENKKKELEKKFEKINKSIEKSGEKKIIESNFFKNKGKIIWPAEGKVVEFFGPKKIKGFKGVINNNGIKIQLTGDGYVYAVFDGEVKYLDWVRGLGNIIIINHDKYFYTLYANIDEVLVTLGQKVKKGDKIGIIDVDLYNNSSYLYFEIRKESIAVDPLNWLIKKEEMNE
ncbi:peptidoglycan DD-metalloendopeptidase family protein [Deferribacter thermophilus]|uniref:murein hydrolase activator EnvC family protein n=1 Tax=Deferribacter thermophilus TaxID=53573 RepID=UPI003C25897C